MGVLCKLVTEDSSRYRKTQQEDQLIQRWDRWWNNAQNAIFNNFKQLQFTFRLKNTGHDLKEQYVEYDFDFFDSKTNEELQVILNPEDQSERLVVSDMYNQFILIR